MGRIKKIKNKRHIIEHERHKAIELASKFLNLGFTDYISSRVLLNQELFYSGAVLISTCIEKYIKAIILLNSNKLVKGHIYEKTPRFIPSSKELEPKMFQDPLISDSFLNFVKKAYQIRYPDDLEIGFNFNLNYKKVLVRLDRIVTIIEEQVGSLLYREYKQIKDKKLFDNNCFLEEELTVDKFFKGGSKLYYLTRFC